MLPFGGAFLPLIGSALGAGLDYLSGRQQQQQNVANQKEFAQNGIQWRVEDARKAGINPLVALGANTQSFSPVTVGTDFASFGQDVGRAMDATRSWQDKTSAYAKTLADLSVERAGLENELLRAQILNIHSRPAQVGPGFPGEDVSYVLPGQGNTALVAAPPGATAVNATGPNQSPSPVAVAVGGNRWAFDPATAGAETIEDRYGDMADWVYGPYVFIQDMLHNNVLRNFVRDRQYEVNRAKFEYMWNNYNR